MSILLSILGWIVFGLIIGAIARLVVPGKQDLSIFMTIILGIVGSLAGGLLTWLFTGANDPYHPAGWIMSIIGAVLVLAIYLSYARRSGRTIP